MRIDQFIRLLIAGTIALSGAIVPATSTIASAPVALSLVPAGTSVQAGDIFDVIIQAQSGSQQVIGVDAYLDFDATKLAVVDMNSEKSGIQISSGVALPVFLWNSANNATGRIAYSAGAFSPYPSGTFTVATVRFQALTATSQAAPVTFSTAFDRRTMVVGDTRAEDITGSLTGASYLINSENTKVPSPGTNGAGGEISRKTLNTSGLTSDPALFINASGVTQNAVRLTTMDGHATLRIPAGTTLLNSLGNPLSLLSSESNGSPAPAAGNALFMAYNFGPSGSTCNPGVALSISYDPAELPENLLESDLYIAYFDGMNWVKLTSLVDPVTKTVNANIHQFCDYALMSKVAATLTSIPQNPPSEDTTGIDEPPATPAVTATVQTSPVPSNSIVAFSPEATLTEEQPSNSARYSFIIVVIVGIVLIGVILLTRNRTNTNH